MGSRTTSSARRRHVGGHLKKACGPVRRAPEAVPGRPAQRFNPDPALRAPGLPRRAGREWPSLRQDDAPFRRLLVDGMTSHATSPGGTRSAMIRRLSEMVRGSQPQQGLAHVPDALSGQGGERHQGLPCALQTRALVLGKRPFIDLVHGDDDGDLARVSSVTKAVLEGPPRAGRSLRRRGRRGRAPPRALHPQFAERAFVVHARGCRRRAPARAAAVPWASRPDPSWCRRPPTQSTPAGA